MPRGPLTLASIKSRLKSGLESPVWPAVRLLYSAGPGHAIGVLIVVSLNSAGTFARIFLTGAIVGGIGPAARGGVDSPAAQRMIVLIVAIGVLAIVSTALGSLMDILTTGLSLRFMHLTQRVAMNATLGPSGVAHLEDSKFMDEVRVALGNDYSSGPFQLPGAVIQTIATRIQGIGSAVILAGFAWWAPAIVAVGLVLNYRWMNRELDNIWKPWTNSSADLRKSRYFRELAVGTPAAKEIRIFGLHNWVIGRQIERWNEGMREIWAERKKFSFEAIRALIAMVAGFAVVYILLARAAVTGTLGPNIDEILERLTIYAQAAAGLAALGSTADAQLLLRNSSNTVKHLLGLESKARSKFSVIEGTRTNVEGMPAEEIRFEDVVFQYPETDNRVFDGLNLTIPAGQSMAIVGDNGAGKTTLVKLLARLYVPNEGRIFIDGVDLDEMDPHAWRERIGVIFQDFVKYHLPARANVGYGALDLAGDQHAVERAARLAGADQIIAELKNGWDTVLSRQYKDGTDLSGGQWQKVALARAILSAQKGGILVLDEPTANLDVRAEAELFERFLELTHGTTTILISHRFSTVRHAELICVLEKGKLIERGPHHELLELGGKYARMFNLQADRFREAIDV